MLFLCNLLLSTNISHLFFSEAYFWICSFIVVFSVLKIPAKKLLFAVILGKIRNASSDSELSANRRFR